MSINYSKTLFKNSSFELIVNYSWISQSKATEELTMEIYAFDVHWSPIFTHTLNIEGIRLLYSHLNAISILKDTSTWESWEFIELTNTQLINFFSQIEEIDNEIISIVLWKISNEEILHSISTLNLDNLSASHKQQKYKLELKKLNLILILEAWWSLLRLIPKIPFISEYSAWQPEKILQNWIEKNLWVFWIEYERLESFREISESSEWDLLMKSIDWYLDLIELKKSQYELLRFDKSHNCYYWSSHLNTVIWQSMHYLKSLQEYASTLSSEYDVKILRPRIKIIAWRSKEFNSQQFDTLRLMNSHFVDISIITYDEILKYGSKIISHYT